MAGEEREEPEEATPPGGANDPERSSSGAARDHEQADTPELIIWAQAGDADALNELFARHYQTMVEMARRRLGSRLRAKEDPDDLAQTTFREATRDFPNYTYRGEGSLLRWLLQILQNKIRDRAEFYSAGKRDFSLERSMEAPLVPGSDPLPAMEPTSPDLTVTMQVERGENYEFLRQALNELSPLHRKAITLVFFQGLSLRQAGERMEGRSEDAVRMMLRRAETRLGELLRGSLGKDLDRP